MAIISRGVFQLYNGLLLRGGGTEPNRAPSDIHLSSASMLEKSSPGEIVGTLTASDPNTWDTFTFVLTDNAGGRFDIVGNRLVAGPVRTDRQQHETLTITVRVIDKGGLSFERDFEIDILERMEPPEDIQLSANRIEENSPQGTLIGILTATDPDPDEHFTFELVNNASGRFQIIGDQLQAGPVKTDYEKASTHLLTIRVIDKDDLAFDKNFVIEVLDVNEAPTDITASSYIIDESIPEGYAIATLKAVDQDRYDSWEFELLNDFDGRFRIDGELLLAGPTPIIASEGLDYYIPIRVTDSGGETLTKAIHFQVNTAPQSITLSSNVIDENSASGTTIGYLATIDPGGGGKTYTYELLDDAEGRFNIVFGNRLVTTSVNLDYEEQQYHTIHVRSWDGEFLYVDKIFTIIVRDRPEPPYDILLSNNMFPENSPQGTVIAKLTALDQDFTSGAFTYALYDSFNSAYVQVVGDELQVGATPVNYETTKQFDVRLTAWDNTGLRLAYRNPNSNVTPYKTVTIYVEDVNEPPTDIRLSGQTVPERSDQGTVIGVLTAVDPDVGDTHEFFLLDSAGGKFQIVGNELQAGPVPTDHLGDGSLSIRVLTRDSGGLEFERNFDISVTRVWRAPVGLTLDNNEIPENSPPDVLVGTFIVDDPDVGDSHTFALMSQSRNYFKIVGNQLFTSTAMLNYEQTEAVVITVRVTDSGGIAAWFPITINVIDVNEPITNLNLVNQVSVPENSPPGFVIGTFAPVDEDRNDTYTYELLDDAGGRVKIVDGVLMTADVHFDYEDYAGGNPQITVKVVDAAGHEYTKSFTITVTDVAERPTGVFTNTEEIDAESAPGSIVASLYSIDDDLRRADQTFTYTLVEDTNGLFNISGNALLRTATPIPAGLSNVRIQVSSRDNTNLSTQPDEEEITFRISTKVNKSVPQLVTAGYSTGEFTIPEEVEQGDLVILCNWVLDGVARPPKLPPDYGFEHLNQGTAGTQTNFRRGGVGLRVYMKYADGPEGGSTISAPGNHKLMVFRGASRVYKPTLTMHSRGSLDSWNATIIDMPVPHEKVLVLTGLLRFGNVNYTRTAPLGTETDIGNSFYVYSFEEPGGQYKISASAGSAYNGNWTIIPTLIVHGSAI